MKPHQIKPYRVYLTQSGVELRVSRIIKGNVTYTRPGTKNSSHESTITLERFATSVTKEIHRPMPLDKIRRLRTYELRSGKIVQVINMVLDEQADQALIYEYARGSEKGQQRQAKLEYFAAQVVRRVD